MVADLAWIVVLSSVAAGFLRRALRGRGTDPVPATNDLTVLIALAVLVASAVWPLLFPAVSFGSCVVATMLLTILLLRVREVWIGRDLLGSWGRRRGVVAAVVPVVLVAAYAAWHPLVVAGVDVDVIDQESAVDGTTSADLPADVTRTDGEDVSTEAGPRETIRLDVQPQAGTGAVRLLAAAPVVPDGAFRLLPTRPQRRNGMWRDGSPLPRRISHREVSTRTFRLRALGRCDERGQRIDGLRARYRRLGRTVTTEVRTDAAVTLHCVRGR